MRAVQAGDSKHESLVFLPGGSFIVLGNETAIKHIDGSVENLYGNFHIAVQVDHQGQYFPSALKLAAGDLQMLR